MSRDYAWRVLGTLALAAVTVLFYLLYRGAI